MLQLLAQATYEYTYNNLDTTTEATSIPPVVIVLYIALFAVLIVSMWKVFVKAGKPGWAAIVPLYNSWVMVQIAGKPPLWFFLLFVPIVNFVIAILLYIEISKRFGKGGGFAAVLILFPYVGFPMLAFGKAQYNSVDGQAGGTPLAPTPPPTPVSSVSSSESTDTTPSPSDELTPQAPQFPQAPTPPAPPAAPSATPPSSPSTPSQPPTQQPPIV
jgi:hypothetical protein